MTYTYPGCGCCFETSGEVNGRPKLRFNPSLDVVPLDCTRTWDLISSGKTKGVFQLESRLGQSLASKLKPENIEQLAALSAIIRPGCSEAMIDDKSITNHYIDRKNGKEEISYYHPALEAALSSTFGQMIYQENAMQIAKDIAGFNLQQADVLRKAIGKKKVEVMQKVKFEFMEGCRSVGIVTEEEAEQIFGWIEKSQRYSFNLSHAVCYAVNGYLAAYAKAHFPKVFYTSYLFYAKEKQKPQDEIRELVNDARNHDVDVYAPDFRNLNDHFRIINQKIYFGFVDIKGIGGSVFDKVVDKTCHIEKMLGKGRGEWTWVEFLVFLSQRVTKTAVIAMIKSGALDYMKVSRSRMEYEYLIYSKVSKTEKPKVERLLLLKDYEGSAAVRTRHEVENLEHVLELIISLGSGKDAVCHTKPRLHKVRGFLQAVVSPPHDLGDTPQWINQEERRLLGVALTASAVDGVDIGNANCNIREFNHGFRRTPIIISCQIDRVKQVKTKNGKNPGSSMAFLEVSDLSGTMENVVVFPDSWEELNGYLFEDNTILISGKKSDRGGIIVEKIKQL